MFKNKIYLGENIEQIYLSILIRALGKGNFKLEIPYIYFDFDEENYQLVDAIAECSLLDQIQSNI